MTDYASEYQALLPSGAAWPRIADSVAAEVARAVAVEFARVDDRAAQLLLEMDPRTTVELIADWERVAGLPDPCAGAIPGTLEGRRLAVVAKIISRGSTAGPGVEFLKDAAVALGYDRDDVLIRRFYQPTFACDSECNDSVNDEAAGWPYLWEVIVKHGALDQTLQCQIEKRYALSHLALSFAFPLFSFADGTFTRAGAGALTDPETGEQTALESDELGTFYYGV